MTTCSLCWRRLQQCVHTNKLNIKILDVITALSKREYAVSNPDPRLSVLIIQNTGVFSGVLFRLPEKLVADSLDICENSKVVNS